MTQILNKSEVLKIDNHERVDFKENYNVRVVNGLNLLLANEFGIFVKTLNYHWNVIGPRFHSLHKFLEKQYREVLELMDDLAERIRSIGGRPVGTLQEIRDELEIIESREKNISASEMIKDLMNAHLIIQDEILSLIKEKDIINLDPGTEDFLLSVLKAHEKNSWMLKSHLEE